MINFLLLANLANLQRNLCGMSIAVKNITKNYGEQKALNGVNFDIGGGEIVGFLGPNGAGKSTMMKILTGFIPPTEGSASVCGFDVEDDSLQVRKRVGYLPEHNPLYLDMYVKEYLGFVAHIHGLKNRRQHVEEMIATVGLEVEQHKKIGALSKGYRQRVGLAQALIHDPDVLILDEPTSGLDPNQIVEIRELIRNVGKEKTVMLSTHIMQEVEAICDRVIIIKRGQIVADNPLGEIISGNQNTAVLTVEFNGFMPREKLESLGSVLQVKQVSDHMWAVEHVATVDIRETIFQLAVDSKLAVLTVNKQEKSLEEVFKSLTSN